MLVSPNAISGRNRSNEEKILHDPTETVVGNGEKCAGAHGSSPPLPILAQHESVEARKKKNHFSCYLTPLDLIHTLFQVIKIILIYYLFISSYVLESAAKTAKILLVLITKLALLCQKIFGEKSSAWLYLQSSQNYNHLFWHSKDILRNVLCLEISSSRQQVKMTRKKLVADANSIVESHTTRLNTLCND